MFTKIIAENINGLSSTQRIFFNTGHTRPIEFRIAQLKKLQRLTRSNEPAIKRALYKDLGKPDFEAYGTETGFVDAEISNFIRHVAGWSKPVKVPTNLINFGGHSYIQPQPLGPVLIISPWNYPFQLAMAPLVAAIGAGNTVVLKPSEYSAHTAAVLKELINNNFDPDFCRVELGGVDVSQKLLAQKWGHIFFTGSPAVGKVVARAAVENLTPTTLELGGKSPAIVLEDADIDLAAKRIVWGKLINSGQTCVAPDYLIIHESRKAEFIAAFNKYVKKFYGENPLTSKDYGHIINERNFNRLLDLLKDQNIISGGESDRDNLKINPTLVEVSGFDSLIMQEEIFGPILPIITFNDESEIKGLVEKNKDPLAMYVFSENKKKASELMATISAGGGGINDTVMHLANPNLPFGGVGASGIGRYHGKAGFDRLSNFKGVLNAFTMVDIPVRYAPYEKPIIGALNRTILKVLYRIGI